jgi:hypothetical protein
LQCFDACRSMLSDFGHYDTPGCTRLPWF